MDYYHLGGTVEFSSKRLRPYFALTMGATRFDLALPDISDEWRFSIGVGGGFKAYVSDRVGVRVDGRIWPTFVNTAGGFFCSASTGCLVSIRSDFFVQGNATVGLFFGF